MRAPVGRAGVTGLLLHAGYLGDHPEVLGTFRERVEDVLRGDTVYAVELRHGAALPATAGALIRRVLLADQLGGTPDTLPLQRDARGVAATCDTLLVLMQQHNMKEENILYPMCDSRIPDAATLLQELRHVTP